MTKKYYDKRFILLAGLTVIFTVILGTTSSFVIEKLQRGHAKQNLEQVSWCMEQLLPKKGVTDKELEKYFKICAGKMKITPTGDMFAFDLNTRKFVFDPSLDCQTTEAVMTENSNCKLHKHPKDCKKALVSLTSGYDSGDFNRVGWRFTNNIEWLEWKVLPTESRGFDGGLRGGLKKPHQVVLVQGIQKNETKAKTQIYYYVLFFISLMMLVMLLVFAVQGGNNDKRK